MNAFVSSAGGMAYAWYAAVRDLLLPRGCAGCDMPDEVLCPSCSKLFRQVCSKPLAGDMGSCYSCAWYRGAARHAVLAWKDHGDEECDAVFSSLLADLIVKVLGTSSGNARSPRLVLVPAPSSKASMRHRGRWQMLPVTKALARDLYGYGFEVRIEPALRLEGVSGKSVQTSGASGRSQRIAGHVRATKRLAGEDVLFLVIDDIVTTGATMGQCISALRLAGARDVMGFALACTPNKPG
ncbi:phosphoribosyltransferase family protein [Bifidobacterium sp. ESL0775]|uniref:ComF family protein n=1 Tax=Bifidobacterium sp. ESL0775 TaxID=2983230 RepID=UPI0023F7731A|nr:phosphoribosyltransferase family protein [Bifidobacterium sp. ESL0775]WEV68775.1 phosphoribosyltransferase family protein [Bifidobacterium sp. ESL0775]